MGEVVWGWDGTGCVVYDGREWCGTRLDGYVLVLIASWTSVVLYY